MKYKRVSFKNSKNNKLDGDLYACGARSLIITCQPLRSKRRNANTRYVTNLFVAGGYDVLNFDTEGIGQSEGFDGKNIKQRVLDVQCVIDYYEEHYDEIVLAGASFGALIAVLTALTDMRVRKLITVVGLFDLFQMDIRLTFMLRLYGFVRPRIKQDLQYFREHYQPQKLTVPTAVLYSGRDWLVGKKQSLDFYNALRCSKKLIQINGSSHFLRDLRLLDSPINQALQWFKNLST